MGYTPHVTDSRESPWIDVADLLERRGAVVSYSDPYVPVLYAEHGHQERRELSFEDAIKQGYDCAVITTNHKAFDYPTIVKHSALVLDTHNALKGAKGERVLGVGA